MKQTSIDCVPCLLRQATEALQLCPSPPEGAFTAVRELLLSCTTINFSMPPPVNAGALQEQVRELTGVTDPYAKLKRRYNQLALELLPSLAKAIRQSPDPFGAAVSLAIAGNVIDLGAKSGLSESEVISAVQAALSQPVAGEFGPLKAAVASAQRILYLCDNAGEIVFDRILLEMLPHDRVTVGVRGQAVLNDATVEDAQAAMISPQFKVISNGSCLPGTVLETCSDEFRDCFNSADLIISKGQGNFETLSDCNGPVFCLFRVKCATVARDCGYPIGSHVIWHA